jgi:5'-nucleotidase
MATKIIIEKKPDIVISGINLGANLGEDTIYSGTVAGAFQSSLLGIPAIAISAIEDGNGGYDLESAGKIIADIAKYILDNPLPEGKILSISVPPSPKGIKLARLGHKRYDAEIVKKSDPRGREYYWIGPGNITTFGSDNSDVNVIKEGYASVVPLSLNFFDNELYDELKGKENEFFKEMV